MSRRTFFLDTNILIGDPDCIYEFGDKPQNTVVLSDIVLAELDNNKNRPDIMSNVRRAIRTINRLTDKNPACYEKEGVYIDHGRGRFRIYSDNPRMRKLLRSNTNLDDVVDSVGDEPENRMIFAPPMDNQNDIALVRQALNYAADNPDEAVTFITRDTSLAAIARINGIHAEFRKTEYVDPNQLHRGYNFFDDEKLYLKLLESCRSHPDKRHIPISEIDAAWTRELIANQYMIYADPRTRISLNSTLNRELIFRYDLSRDELVGIPREQPRIFGRIKPYTFPQALLIETAKSGVHGIAVSGGAGTGKTYLLLALALERIIQTTKIRTTKEDPPGKLYISKRDVKVANEQLGFAPGERENKLKLHGVATNYAQIARTAQLGTDYGVTLMEAMRDDDAIIELIPMGEIRGMNVMDNEGLLIEEAQNMEYGTAKAVTTRVAKGGFYFLNGDCHQPDNPFLSESNNGLTRTMHAIIQMSYYARGITPEEFKGVDRYYQRRQRKNSDNPRQEAKELARTMGLMFLPTIVRGPIAKFGVNWL